MAAPASWHQVNIRSSAPNPSPVDLATAFCKGVPASGRQLGLQHRRWQCREAATQKLKGTAVGPFNFFHVATRCEGDNR